MSVKIKSQGDYELFKTTKQHKILVLDGKQWFAAIEGQQGDILVHSDSDHAKGESLQKGHFYMAEFKDDPKFNDVPHLFLEKGSSYQEVVLPNGLPTTRDHQKRVVWTNESIGKQELEQHLRGNGKSKGTKSSANGGRLPIANYDDLTVDEVRSRLGDLNADERKRILRYEEQHKGRKTLLAALEH
jgi:hypothetical protein